MLRRPHYIALGLVGLLTLVVLNLPQHTASQLKLALGSLFLPLFGLSKSSQQVVHQTGEAMTTRAELSRQNDGLRLANQQLQLRTMQMDATMRENERLRQLLGWQQKQTAWRPKLAKIIARDPANWWQTITIDLGTRDGLRADLAVMTPAGLVGRVSSVSLTSSQVMLIGNPNCKVSALIEKTRENGVIIGGSGPFDNTLVSLSFLSSSSSLKPGEVVKTSGLGGIFPKDILIGQVAEDSHQVELGYMEARVKLAVNLSMLEEVWVLLP
ncbi:MAG: mreC [Pedosphaera sp.]|nr:mreC [Pedosphaera sp.]